jgi:hypothetical protein
MKTLARIFGILFLALALLMGMGFLKSIELKDFGGIFSTTICSVSFLYFSFKFFTIKEF